MASRTTHDAERIAFSDPEASVRMYRRANRLSRLNGTKRYLRQQLALLEERMRELGVPDGAWEGLFVQLPAVTNPAADVLVDLPRGIIGWSAYHRWRGCPGVNGTPQADEADWCAAEAWTIRNLLSALKTRDLQHIVNLSRILTACQANRMFPGRQAEIHGERISKGLGRKANTAEVVAFVREEVARKMREESCSKTRAFRLLEVDSGFRERSARLRGERIHDFSTIRWFHRGGSKTQPRKRSRTV